MCGIFCLVYHQKEGQHSSESNDKRDEWDHCKSTISARGPDGLFDECLELSKEWRGHFAASILWTQGAKLVAQPCIDDNGNVLLWNGDIFSGPLADNEICDTLSVLNTLKVSDDICSTFQAIQGPYSFVYFQRSSKRLYFGRDPIGRHSLLLKLDPQRDSLLLCSVANKNTENILEVPAVGIFFADLNNSQIHLSCHPWRALDTRFVDVIENFGDNLNVDIDVKRAVILSEVKRTSFHVEPEINEIQYLEEVQGSFDEIMQRLLENKSVYERVERLLELLNKSVEVRVKKKPNYCRNCVRLVLRGERINCAHSKVGLLFSGGLDSAILAVIANKYVAENESIDLLNVAFEKVASSNPSYLKHAKKNREKQEDECRADSTKYDVPDRKTGKRTYAELLRICPSRKWNFIEINVTQQELKYYRSARIGDLVYPLRTILDESLGCAVWFASRAKGVVSSAKTLYESPCRILLLGMGADESFGGYMRHRTTLKHKGWATLTRELCVELDRISERNLGRDDRIVSDHGRQSRLPYLDENVIEFVQSLKPWERCYPTDSMPAGLGDKLLLRLLARKIGLQDSANFPKRAFQFGSRIANGKENAKDISDRL